jgi:hypothetical protein
MGWRRVKKAFKILKERKEEKTLSTSQFFANTLACGLLRRANYFFLLCSSSCSLFCTFKLNHVNFRREKYGSNNEFFFLTVIQPLNLVNGRIY